MTRKLQILRGTTAQNNAYTGAVGELTMDTDRNEVRIHDGQTVGGIKIGDRNMPILTSMFFDHVVNDMSWLRADTFSWQSGDVYVAAYNHLVGDLNTNVIENGVTYYAWKADASTGLPVLYTSSETPSVGDMVLYYNGEFREYEPITAVGDGYIEVLYDGIAPLRLGRLYGDTQTDTIGSITITYYLAEDGHKICLPDQEANLVALYEATGVAWYYILDTANKQFKLPRSKHNKYIDTAPVIGNGMALGLTDGTNNAGIYDRNMAALAGSAALQLSKNAYGTSVGTTVSEDTSWGTNPNKTIGITTDPAKSGIVAQQTQDTDQYKYLYFYVGNFEQSAIEQTAGITAETLNGKADTDLGNITDAGRTSIAGVGMPSDTSTDLTLGTSGSTYTAPADGWFYAQKTVNANTSQYITIVNISAKISSSQNASGNGAIVRGFVPVKKGDTVSISYSAGGASTLRFIYSEGTKHLA